VTKLTDGEKAILRGMTSAGGRVSAVVDLLIGRIEEAVSRVEATENKNKELQDQIDDMLEMKEW
jgi:hypothetical protein